jgi:hypothetical protein
MQNRSLHTQSKCQKSETLKVGWRRENIELLRTFTFNPGKKLHYYKKVHANYFLFLNQCVIATLYSLYAPFFTIYFLAFLHIKGTVSWDRLKKFWQKITELGLTKGRGWF